MLNTIQAESRRVNTNDVIKFIMDNLKVMKNIDVVDYHSDELDSSDRQRDLDMIPLKRGERRDFYNFSSNISNIFKTIDQPIYRYGILDTIQTKDVSLFASVFTCIKDDFTKLSESDQEIFIKRFLMVFYRDIMYDSYAKFGYAKLKWDKKDFMKDVSEWTVNKHVIRYLSDYLHINIFIFDQELDSVIYGGGHFNPYKKSLCLVRIQDSHFEPLSIGDRLYFTKKDKIIENLLTHKNLVEVFNLDYSKGATRFEFHIELETLQNVKDEKQEENNDRYTNSDAESFSSDDSEDNSHQANLSDESDKESDDNNEHSITNASFEDIRTFAKNKGIPISYMDGGKRKTKTKLMLIDDIKKLSKSKTK